MKNTAPRINDQAAEFYPTAFKTLNRGLEYTLESMPALYKRTLIEIKGIFTANELNLIIDVFNSPALTPGFAGGHIAANVADGIDLDGLDKKWKIDATAINSKVRGLTVFQAAVLEIWANGFWYSANAGKNLKKYVKGLITE